MVLLQFLLWLPLTCKIKYPPPFKWFLVMVFTIATETYTVDPLDSGVAHFMWCWGSNTGLCACWVRTLPTEVSPTLFVRPFLLEPGSHCVAQFGL